LGLLGLLGLLLSAFFSFGDLCHNVSLVAG
jgi:hypothetical protein